jgi:hypothetical protein
MKQTQPEAGTTVQSAKAAKATEGVKQLKHQAIRQAAV